MCSFLFSNIPFDVNGECNRYIKLRGPDNTNHVEVNGFHFMHNLLSITGKFTIQPTIEDDIVCLFNGEIYNYKKFGNYDNDSKCLIPLYKEYGDLFVKQLDGEFAIVLVDFKKQIILASTDVFATKPLWIGNENGNIGMSIYESPLKALGFNKSTKVQANTTIKYNLVDFKVVKETTKVFDFDLKQHKQHFDDWNIAFNESIVKRSCNDREKIFIGLSSGYDSGSIACELNKITVKFKAYNVVGTENKNILNSRFELIKNNCVIEQTDYSHSNHTRQISHSYIKQHVENFMYVTYSSSSDYNEFNLSVHDDNGSNSLSHICNLAKNDGYKIYLSGQGADELFSDYGFGGIKKYKHSNFGGLFPEDLSTIFPWASFYGSSQISYLMKEEAVAGSYGLETRYPFLDPKVVQEFLWITSNLKNKWYKSPLHQYLTINNFPFCEGEKIGF